MLKKLVIEAGEVMISLVAIAPLIILLLLTAYIVSRGVQDSKLMEQLSPENTISREPPGTADPVDNVDAEDARALYARLLSDIKREDPDFVLGVHFSGLMLAAKLVDDLYGSFDKLLYLENTKLSPDIPRLYTFANGRMPRGKVCVVDDISREGYTLRLASNYIFDSFIDGAHRFSDVSYFTLLLHESTAKSKATYFRPTSFYKATTNRSINLPWTTLVRELRTSFQKRNAEKIATTDPRLRDYLKMVSEPAFAAFCLETSMSAPKAYEVGMKGSFYELYKTKMSSSAA